MPLPDQQPAAVEQLQAPDRMAGVHEVATGLRPRLTPLPPILPHELTLLLPIRLPEEAGDLVVAGPDAMQQVLHPGAGVSHAEVVVPFLSARRVEKGRQALGDLAN